MPFTSGSSLLDFIIVLSVALSLLMTVALLVALIVIRSRNTAYFHHRNELTKRWRAIFKTAYTGESLPEPLPAIGVKDRFTVMGLFVAFHEVREKDVPRSAEVLPKLDALASRIGLSDYALALLDHGDDADKILALNVLGQVRDGRAIEAAIELTRNDGAELSRAAAQCAIRIAPGFVGEVLQLVLARNDWTRSRIELILREVDPNLLGSAMREAIAGAPEEAKPRLLDFVRLCPVEIARAICTDVLSATHNPEAVASALRSLAPLANENDHDLALRYAHHENSIVALSAMRVLRKCARPEDRELLQAMMSNPDYWVRLRAAEAAVALLHTKERVDEFAAGLTDQYARDVLTQVLAERVMAAHRTALPDRRRAPSIESAA